MEISRDPAQLLTGTAPIFFPWTVQRFTRPSPNSIDLVKVSTDNTLRQLRSRLVDKFDERIRVSQPCESGTGLTGRVCTEAAEWDDFISEIPWATAQHSFSYGRILESCFNYLHSSYRLLLSNGKPVAALPLFYFSFGPFRAIYSLAFNMYGGPLLAPTHLDDKQIYAAIGSELKREAERCGAFEARFSLPPNTPDILKRSLASILGMEITESECPVLPLDRPLSEIVTSYHPSVRQAIRKSARSDVVVKVNPPLEEIRRAFPIYQARMRRIGATAKPWRFMKALLRQGPAVAFIARVNGEPIGLLILLVSPQLAIYWQSAFLPDASGLRPMNALVDAGIRWCHEQGVAMFSFGESHGQRPGLVRFKLGWNPVRLHATLATRTYRPKMQKVWYALEPAARRVSSSWEQRRETVR